MYCVKHTLGFWRFNKKIPLIIFIFIASGEYYILDNCVKYNIIVQLISHKLHN